MHARDISRDIKRDRTRPETSRRPTPTEEAPLARIRYFVERVHGLDADGGLATVWMAGIENCPFCGGCHEHPIWPALVARKPVLSPLIAGCDERGRGEGGGAIRRRWYRLALTRPVALRPLGYFHEGYAWPDEDPDDDGGKAS